MRRPALYVGDILSWADAFQERAGRWPSRDDGPVVGVPDLTWRQIDSALKLGNRCLPPGSSLARLLLARRKRRHKGYPPTLTPSRILDWADAHHRRTGMWPIDSSGAIPGVPGETWTAVDKALRVGRRGLPGGSSLARFLEEHRGVRNIQAAPRLTPGQVLAWADAHRARTGRWPTRSSGPIPDAPGESWSAVAEALVAGARGLAGSGSLAQLLAHERGARNHMAVPRLTAELLLAWADAHHDRTGRWPTRSSGPIPDVPGESWSAVAEALVAGVRGMPGGDSLARFLGRHRAVRNKQALPALSLEQVSEWIRAHHARTGQWPRHTSGPISDAPGETWSGVGSALARGGRGLTRGRSLHQMVSECREDQTRRR